MFKDKKARPVAIFLMCCLCLTLLLTGIMAYQRLSSHNTGVSITSTTEKSVDEIKAELNKQVEESKMTISVNAKCKIENGMVRVNVENVSGNKFDQSFELIQNGKVLYSSDLIRPGESVEWCEAPEAQVGDAIITISPHNSGETQLSGNPQSAQIKLIAS